MTIENPQTHRLNEQGGVMPPEANQTLYEQVPEPRTSPDTYNLPPQKEEDEPGFFKRNWGKVALLTAGVVAAGSYYLGAAGHDSAPQNIPDTGSQPSATGEQFPGGSAPTGASAETQTSTPEANTELGVTLNGQTMPVEVAKATYFEVNQGKAPSPTEAGKQWVVALQNGARVNVSREAVSEGGGAQAVEEANLDLLTGEDGLLLGLGSDHNKVSQVDTDFVQPATLVYNLNKSNIEDETFSRLYLTGTTVSGTDAGGYTVLGDLTVTTMQGETALSSVTYKAEIHEKLDPQTGKWDYTGSHVMKAY